MFTQLTRRLLSIMAKPEHIMVGSREGDEELSKIHDEYLKNSPRVD